MRRAARGKPPFRRLRHASCHERARGANRHDRTRFVQLSRDQRCQPWPEPQPLPVGHDNQPADFLQVSGSRVRHVNRGTERDDRVVVPEPVTFRVLRTIRRHVMKRRKQRPRGEAIDRRETEMNRRARPDGPTAERHYPTSPLAVSTSASGWPAYENTAQCRPPSLPVECSPFHTLRRLIAPGRFCICHFGDLSNALISDG